MVAVHHTQSLPFTWLKSVSEEIKKNAPEKIASFFSVHISELLFFVVVFFKEDSKQ